MEQSISAARLERRRKFWEIRHSIPGRVRLYSPRVQGNRRWAHGVESSMHKLAGVRLVRANAVSGSVLIVYDPAVQSDESLITALCECHPAHERRHESMEDREVHAIRSVAELLGRWDHVLIETSHGAVSLRKIAMAFLSVRAGYHIAGAGMVSLEAIESVWEVFLAWVLFRHPRLEREVQRVESYVTPP